MYTNFSWGNYFPFNVFVLPLLLSPPSLLIVSVPSLLMVTPSSVVSTKELATLEMMLMPPSSIPLVLSPANDPLPILPRLTRAARAASFAAVRK